MTTSSQEREFAPDKFVLYSSFNRSKFDGKENEYWAKGEWPLDQILALANWATNEAEKITNIRGEQCVVVSQKLLPRIAKDSGNAYLMGVTSDPKPMQPRFDDNEVL